MQFKPYPEYQDSGVEWLGDVPAQWEVLRTKNVFNHRREEARHDDEIVTAFRDGQVTLRKNRRTDGFTNSLQEHGYQHIVAGDLVIHEMDAFAGAIGVSDSNGKSTPVYTVCYPKNRKTDNHYYAHFFRTMASYGYINSLAKGIRVRSTEFRWNESRNVYLCVPTYDDQASVVSFLDQETSKIDLLISKQEKLIELLEEQRKSIISHAVTKGIDPNAPLKDSDVEWLGEVPAHWDIAALKHYVSTQAGFAFNSDDYTSEGYPIIRIGDLQDGSISLDSVMRVKYLSAQLETFRITKKFNNILMAMTGATVGKVALYQNEADAFINQRVCAFNSRLLNNRYLWYLVNAANYKEYIELEAYGGAQPNISERQLTNFIVSIPSIDEQSVIASYLDEETSKIDIAIDKQKQLIEKLKEYRSSIISHAVTGKIDVRDFAA